MQTQAAKRINIVQVKLIREKSMLYKNRQVKNPQSAYEIIQEFLGDVDREHFVVLVRPYKVLVEIA